MHGSACRTVVDVPHRPRRHPVCNNDSNVGRDHVHRAATCRQPSRDARRCCSRAVHAKSGGVPGVAAHFWHSRAISRGRYWQACRCRRGLPHRAINRAISTYGHMWHSLLRCSSRRMYPHFGHYADPCLAQCAVSSSGHDACSHLGQHGAAHTWSRCADCLTAEGPPAVTNESSASATWAFNAGRDTPLTHVARNCALARLVGPSSGRRALSIAAGQDRRSAALWGTFSWSLVEPNANKNKVGPASHPTVGSPGFARRPNRRSRLAWWA